LHEADLAGGVIAEGWGHRPGRVFRISIRTHHTPQWFAMDYPKLYFINFGLKPSCRLISSDTMSQPNQLHFSQLSS
jgi:hypothetical protein